MSRFKDNQDGTISDTDTDLTWQKKRLPTAYRPLDASGEISETCQ